MQRNVFCLLVIRFFGIFLLQDILSQMHHYNSGVKHGALVGLREILSAHPSLLDTHISSIMSEVTAVFTDKDPMVRSGTISVLQHLAPMISQEKIAPFFPLISAHLSSAMTHIMPGIQEDSLKILDNLLEEYPDLLIDRSSMLLNNFLELISHQKKELKNADKAPAWTLSVNPNRKITSQKWRISVLGRLKKFLQALVKRAVERYPDKEQLHDGVESELAVKANVHISWQEHAPGQQQIRLFDCEQTQLSKNSSFHLRYVCIYPLYMLIKNGMKFLLTSNTEYCPHTSLHSIHLPREICKLSLLNCLF